MQKNYFLDIVLSNALSKPYSNYINFNTVYSNNITRFFNKMSKIILFLHLIVYYISSDVRLKLLKVAEATIIDNY